MTRVSCPRCKCALEVSVDAEYDDWIEYRVEAVPLRNQPCLRYVWRGRVCLLDGYSDAYRGDGLRGVECNWLGAECNDPAHVTPCYDVTRAGAAREVRYNRRHQSRALARCVQGK